MLVKDGLDVKISEHLMDTTVAAIWVKIGARGRRPMTLCAVYREHRYILQPGPGPNETGTPQKQYERWVKFVSTWARAAAEGDVTVLGDLNLDYIKWANPEEGISRMVEKVKVEVETLGFQQMVQGPTRTLRDQPQSNLDHCWMNNPGRLIFHKNLERAYSDHNLILIQFRTKNVLNDRHEVVIRDRRNYNKEEYKQRIASINWTEFNNSENIDIKNDILEKNILEVLNSVAPVITIQRRNSYRNWVSDLMKTKMKERDDLRIIAKNSNRLEDWKIYKTARNACIKGLRDCKRDYHVKLFEQVEQEKTTKGLYRLTRQICGLKSVSTPQQYIHEGVVVRKSIQMANLQQNYYINKVSKLLRKIPVSNRNPHRFLDQALENWEEKDRGYNF